VAATDTLIASLNSGEVSRLALARADLAKLRVATQVQTNFLPHVLGPCQMRPGTQFLDHTKSDLAGKFIEFYFDEVTKALLVLTPLIMRIMINGAYLTRPAVTAAVTNGTFPANIAGWTISDEAGAATTWSSAGSVQFIGTGTNYAQIDQQIVCGNVGVEHGVRVVTSRGPLRVQIGTVQGDNTYVDAQLLAEGAYSLSFTPSGNFWIRIGAQQTYGCYLSSVTIEASGIVEIPTPWNTGDLANIFYDQSSDVLFVAGGKTIRQYRIERRSSDSHSWGVGAYYALDGPFRLANITDVSLTPSGVVGHPTLIASRPYFKSGHVGALFRLTHSGQTATASLAAQNTFTGAIRVSGITDGRIFSITVGGTFNATVTLQRSFGVIGAWQDVESYTVPTSKTFKDGLDNQIVFYRLGIKTGNYVSGSADCVISFAGSVQAGICRVTDIVNNQTANVDVLVQFGATTATNDWSEGKWSLYRGFPSAVALHDGRLFWQTGINIDGSVSDAFASFDDTVIGDSAPISRTIATGGQDGGRWLLSLQRLIAGTAAQEISIRASAFDEPLTPTQFVARTCSTRGAARVRAVKVDIYGIFVERNDQRVFELAYEFTLGDYKSRELTRLKQEMCAAGVKSVAVQRQPDTRVWFVLKDGTCAVLTYEKEDDVAAWVPVTTPGLFEDVAVLPGTDEDEVYFIVNRTINSSTVRFIERLAKRTECVGGILNKTLDCHVVQTGASTNTIAAAHLPNTPIVTWADGGVRIPPDAPVTTNGTGFAVLPGPAASNIVSGLPYTAQLQTVKLAYGAEHGTALTMTKRVARVGFMLADVAWHGFSFGRDFAHMTGLPPTYKGRPLGAAEVLTEWDDIPSSFNGGWDSDSRVCFQVQSPYPCTIKGLVLDMETNEPNESTPPRQQG
jgi:hypothetical protein